MVSNPTVGRRISTREATIKTAMVEVKALVIGGRQVTLAVFRQLQEEALVDPVSLEYRGIPWGRVHYFWGDCPREGHLHVVWQSGDQLRRCCVDPGLTDLYLRDRHISPRYTRLAADMNRLKGAIFWASVLEGKGRIIEEGFKRMAVSMPGHVYDLNAGPRHAEADYLLSTLWGGYRMEGEQIAKAHRLVWDFCAEALAKVEEVDVRFDSPEPTPQSLQPFWREASLKHAFIETQWQVRYQEMLALDQLFIAV